MDARCFLRIVTLLLCVLVGWSGPVLAAPQAAQQRSPWTRTMRVTWQNAAIVDVTSSLARGLEVSFVIDRRVNTEIRLNLAAEGSVTHILEQALAPHTLALFTTSSLGYIARSEDVESLTRKIDEVAERCERLPPRLYATLTKTTPIVTVPLLADPRETLADIARKNKLTWRNLDELPHDRWRETTFPPMPLSQLLTIILAGYGANWDIAGDGKTLVIKRNL